MTIDEVKRRLSSFSYDVNELLRLRGALLYVRDTEDVNLYPNVIWESFVPRTSPNWSTYYNLFYDLEELKKEVSADIVVTETKINQTLKLLDGLSKEEMDLIYYKFELKQTNEKIGEEIGLSKEGARDRINRLCDKLSQK